VKVISWMEPHERVDSRRMVSKGDGTFLMEEETERQWWMFKQQIQSEEQVLSLEVNC